ncbi:MAG: hypothetical protein ACTS4Z_00020 [Candidatus Hodgkinia cicadicola]
MFQFASSVPSVNLFNSALEDYITNESNKPLLFVISKLCLSLFGPWKGRRGWNY